MAEHAEPPLPVAPLPDILGWWQAEQVRGVVIGGLAVALLGRPRVTRDIDALVLLPEERWPTFLETARRFGLAPRLHDALAFALESRVLLLRHDATAIDVDVALGCLPFEQEVIDRSQLFSVADTRLWPAMRVWLPTPEDLIIMKAVAHRERDLIDIDSLLQAHPDLDTRRVRRWVRAFAEALDMPEIYTDIKRRLRRGGHRPKKDPP